MVTYMDAARAGLQLPAPRPHLLQTKRTCGLKRRPHASATFLRALRRQFAIRSSKTTVLDAPQAANG